MIHLVLQCQVKKRTPALGNTGAPPGETRTEVGAETGALSDEIRTEGEALPSEAGTKAAAPPSSGQVLPFCDDDAGEGPSSLISEKAVPIKDEDKEEMFEEEQNGKLKQELGGQSATSKTHPKRPLLGLVLTPTRELAVQVRQHIDAVARFTGEA